MNVNINVANKSKILKIIGFVATAGYMVANGFQLIPSQLDSFVVTMLISLGLWVLPSPVLRTGAGSVTKDEDKK